MFADLNNNGSGPRPGARTTRRMPSKEEIMKNGFYHDVLNPQEQRVYRAAQANPGLEPEIDLLRKMILSILEKGDPRNFRLLPRAFRTLTSLVRTNDRIRGRTRRKRAGVNETLDQFLSRLVQKNTLSSE